MSLQTTVRSLARRLRPSRQAYTTRRDRAIARQLHTTFERDLTPAATADLHFYTYKGIVTIYGTARPPLDGDLLVSLVRAIPGVRGVAANLQTADSESSAPTPDGQAPDAPASTGTPPEETA